MIDILINGIIIVLFHFIFSTFMTWFIHWFFHRPWTMFLYTKHMQHHQNDDGKILFSYFAIPFLCFITLCTILGFLTPFIGIWCLFNICFWTSLNDFIHINIHKQNTWLNKFSVFHKLRKLHLTHHQSPSQNFGIVWHQWDKWFKTLNTSDY